MQNSKCWFLGKNLSNFVSPIWKLHNPYCHIKESCQTHKQTNHYEEIKKHKIAIKESRNLAKFGKFCDFCNLEFENTEAFKEHQQQKHEDGKFKVCQYCDKKLHHWLGLKCHIDRKHPGAKYLFFLLSLPQNETKIYYVVLLS